MVWVYRAAVLCSLPNIHRFSHPLPPSARLLAMSARGGEGRGGGGGAKYKAKSSGWNDQSRESVYTLHLLQPANVIFFCSFFIPNTRDRYPYVPSLSIAARTVIPVIITRTSLRDPYFGEEGRTDVIIFNQTPHHFITGYYRDGTVWIVRINSPVILTHPIEKYL